MAAKILDPVGANYTLTHASPVFQLGEKGKGTNGSEWVYAKASGAVTAYQAVGIDEDFTAYPLTSALAARSDFLGFAQAACATTYYTWIATKGSDIKVRTKASAVADTQLWTTASAGVLDDATSAAALKIDGVVLVSSASTAANGAAGIEVKASWPAIRET